jgi:hypothetical protein
MPLALTGGYSAVQFRYPAELSLTLRKIAHFCIGNLISAHYRGYDGHYKKSLEFFAKHDASMVFQERVCKVFDRSKHKTACNYQKIIKPKLSDYRACRRYNEDVVLL